MNSVGIITEYNPFHNGHLYQIKQVRKLFPNSTLVVVMSGNFLQRGEPAIFDKWTRAKEALKNDVDLILELPILACMQAADKFAYGAVKTLASLGVGNLVFGAEHAKYDFMDYAKKTIKIDGNFKKYDESYAKIFQNEVSKRIGLMIDTPNDLLGLAYAKANLSLDCPLNLYPIQRIQANYHEKTLKTNSTIASASAIRANRNNKESLKKFVPKETLIDLLNERIISWDNFWDNLKYKLISQPLGELRTVYGMNEGIEHRMKRLALEMDTPTFNEWIQALKNKRFTYTRLSRLATATLLDIREYEVDFFEKNFYIRILGFNQKGQKFLNKAKKISSYPLITKVTQKAKKNLLSVDYRVGKIYQMVSKKEQDIRQAPVTFGLSSKKH